MCEHIYEACFAHYGEDGPGKRKFNALKDPLLDRQLKAVVDCLRLSRAANRKHLHKRDRRTFQNGLHAMVALRYAVKNDNLKSYYEGLRKTKPSLTATLGSSLAMAA